MNEKVSGCWSDVCSKESIESRHKESFQNVNICQRTQRNFLILHRELEIPAIIVTAMPRNLSTFLHEHWWSSSVCNESKKTIMDLLYYWKDFIVSMSHVPLHLFLDDLIPTIRDRDDLVPAMKCILIALRVMDCRYQSTCFRAGLSLRGTW